MGMTGGPEAVENAVAATLRATLNAELDALNAQAGDSTPLPHPVLIHAGQLDLIREFPTIVVASVDGTETADGAPVWGEFDHTLDVVALLVSDRQDVLDRQTKRYAWALWKALMKNQGLDGSLSGQAGVSSVKYGRSVTYPSEKKPLLERIVAWKVIVHVEESV